MLHPEAPLDVRIFLFLHIVAGTFALAVAPVAMIVKKGGTTHRRWGKSYVYAMLVVALTSLRVAPYFGDFFFQPKTPPAPNTVLVKSPIVGTYYESSSADSPPFVREGEKVLPGKVLCIIESMKLMNEIEADVAGILESKLVPNGQPVEYGEALFAIRPL